MDARGPETEFTIEKKRLIKWSPSGQCQVVTKWSSRSSKPWIFISFSNSKARDKNLTYKKLKTHTHLSGPGLPKGALFF